MASIYKKDGSPYWWICYYVEGRKHDKSLKVHNKEAAIRLRNKIEEQIVLGEAGLLVQEERSIDEFVPIFIALSGNLGILMQVILWLAVCLYRI